MDDLSTRFARAKAILSDISDLAIEFKEKFGITILCACAVGSLVYTIIRFKLYKENFFVLIKNICWEYFYVCSALFVFRYLPQCFDIFGDILVNLLNKLKHLTEGNTNHASNK